MSLFEVKVTPERFRRIRDKKEPFLVTPYEVTFKPGDTVWLCEFLKGGKEFTGRRLSALCTSVLTDYDEEGIVTGFCVLTLRTVRELKDLGKKLLFKGVKR